MFVAGRISLASPLDFERDQQSYSLKITARDKAGGNDTTLVRVAVHDVNDHGPRFVQQKTPTINFDEEQPENTLFHTVDAVDEDLNGNETTRYYIKPTTNADVSINPLTGEMIMHDKLDFDSDVQPNHFTFEVYVYDSAMVRVVNNIFVAHAAGVDVGNFVDNVTVVLQVRDVNDNSPQFVEFVSSVTVSEVYNAYEQAIVTVNATDEDTHTDYVDLEYFLVGNPVGFVITSDGQLFFSAPGVVDYDSNVLRNRTVFIGVRNRDNTNYFGYGATEDVRLLSILSTPEIDEAPFFSSTVTEYTIFENTAVNTTIDILDFVDVLDRDVGSNDFLTFYFTSVTDYFRIENSNQIIVNQKLDREEVPAHIVTIGVVDQGGLRAAQDWVLTIRLQDVNDETPQFTQQAMEFEIDEDNLHSANLPYKVTTIAATDDDEPGTPQSTVTVRILYNGTVAPTRFNVTELGELQILSPLDYENVNDRVFEIMVQITDNGSPMQLNSTALFVVRIRNNNDNAPSVDSFNTMVTVAENTLGRVFDFAFSDVDGDELVVDLNPASEYFELTPDSRGLRVRGDAQLDKEALLQNTLDVTVRATDRKYTVTETVSITITDVNDEGVTLVNTGVADLAIREDAEDVLITSFSASDLDVDAQNREVNFTFTDSEGGISPFGLFRLDPSSKPYEATLLLTGSLLYADNANRQQPFMHTLTITATNIAAPHYTSALTVVIYVRRLNEMAPSFAQQSYTVPVGELETIGMVISTGIVASDTDEAENGEVTYHLVHSHPRWAVAPRVDNTLRLVVLQKLDMDYAGYADDVLSIVASDNGQPQKTSPSVNVTIALVDANDNYGTFDGASTDGQVRTIYVSEAQPVDEPITTFLVSDIDHDVANRQSVFILSTANDVHGNPSVVPFRLGSASGSLYVSGNIDYETLTAYTFSFDIIANQNVFVAGGRALVAPKLHVEIHIVDENDVVPVVPPLYLANISEYADVSTVVAEVQAEDGDTTSEFKALQYVIVSGNVGDAFAVSPAGVVRTAKKLVPEVVDQYTLVVAVSDANFTVNTTVRVFVEDENNHAPVFQTDIDLDVLEYTDSSGMSVVRTPVYASDADATFKNRNVTYSITSTSTSPFTIHPASGVLTPTRALDYDSGDTVFSVTVQATDGGVPPLSATKTFTVRLVNLNDNAPHLDENSRGDIAVDENTEIGTVLKTLYATDADNRATTISISSTEVNASIVVVDGSVRVNRPLDFEGENVHVITVRVSDNDIHDALNSSALETDYTITVRVQDVNDNTPQFVSSGVDGQLQGVVVEEQAAVEILSVALFDADGPGPQSNLTVSLQNSFGGKFMVVTTPAVCVRHCVVTVASTAPIDREENAIAVGTEGTPLSAALLDETKIAHKILTHVYLSSFHVTCMLSAPIVHHQVRKVTYSSNLFTIKGVHACLIQCTVRIALKYLCTHYSNHRFIVYIDCT